MHIKHLVITDYKGVLDTKIMESIVAKAMEPYRERDTDQCEQCKLLRCCLDRCSADLLSKWNYWNIHSGYGDFAAGVSVLPVVDISKNGYESVIMPNGVWIEKGMVGWGDTLSDILTAYGYCRAILVDYHC